MADPIGPQLLLQFVLLVLHAFFVAAESSVMELNDTVLRHEAEQGDRRARQLLRLLDVPNNFLSAVQVGITLSGFFLAAFGVYAFAPYLTVALARISWLANWSNLAVFMLAMALVTLILACVVLLFGQLLPKCIAVQKPWNTARITCGAIGFLLTIFWPFSRLLTALCRVFMRIVGIDPDAKRDELSEDEIRLMVDMGEESGAIETSEKEMIKNIFDFNNRTAGEIMVHRKDMVILWLDDTPEEIVQTIRQSGMSRFPVCKDDVDDVIGILSTRAYLLNAQLPTPQPLETLVRKAYFVPETVPTDALFRDMQTRKVHMSIVVDEYGGTSGLLTMEDLLEQLVGDIYDEFDREEVQHIVPLGNDTWKMHGSVDIETLSETLALTLSKEEEEEYDTLGGLIFGQLSVVPEDGTTPQVDVWGLHIEVLALKDRRVQWAQVQKKPLS